MVNLETTSFLYVSRDVSFEESARGVRIYGTFMELDKPSINGRIYRFVEGPKIAKSLIGKPLFYGTKVVCRGLVCKRIHDLNRGKIGFVESAKVIGNKIKGVVKVTSSNIISRLKKGIRFMFSVGGIASFERKLGAGIRKLYGAICTHLQLLDEKAGFPSAKIEKILEFNESALYVGLGHNPAIKKAVVAYIVRRRRNE